MKNMIKSIFKILVVIATAALFIRACTSCQVMQSCNETVYMLQDRHYGYCQIYQIDPHNPDHEKFFSGICTATVENDTVWLERTHVVTLDRSVNEMINIPSERFTEYIVTVDDTTSFSIYTNMNELTMENTLTLWQSDMPELTQRTLILYIKSYVSEGFNAFRSKEEKEQFMD